jgi:hypothetical protein
MDLVEIWLLLSKIASEISLQQLRTFKDAREEGRKPAQKLTITTSANNPSGTLLRNEEASECGAGS